MQYLKITLAVGFISGSFLNASATTLVSQSANLTISAPISQTTQQASEQTYFDNINEEMSDRLTLRLDEQIMSRYQRMNTIPEVTIRDIEPQ